MNFSTRIAVSCAGAGLLLLLVAGCQKNDAGNGEKGPAERAGQQLDRAAERAGKELNKAAEKTGEGLQHLGQKIQNEAQEADRQDSEKVPPAPSAQKKE